MPSDRDPFRPSAATPGVSPTALALSLALALGAGHAGAAGWYVGAGGGVSRLTPDASDSRFALEEKSSAAVGVFGGRTFGSRYAAEFGATRLGEAGLSGEEAIEYSVISAGALGYVFGDPDRIRRGETTGGYLKLGLGAIDNESDVPLEREDDLSIWAAVGLDVPFGRTWAFRAELASFDGDAQAALASLVWRPVRRASGPASAPVAASSPVAGAGADPRGTASPPEPAPAVVPAPAPLPDTARAPVAPPAPPSSADAPDPVEAVAPVRPATPPASSCPPSSGAGPLDARGCPLFDGVRPDIVFAAGTSTPTAAGERALAALAADLLAHPGITVEIRAHAGDGANPVADKTLSRERALATARALAGRGVPVPRLRARAFGSERPPAEPGAALERVELGIVPP